MLQIQRSVHRPRPWDNCEFHLSLSRNPSLQDAFMNNPVTPNPENSIVAAIKGFRAVATVEEQNISYLTLPLLIMATVVEFVILATGWKYQQAVCLPQGWVSRSSASGRSARPFSRWNCSSYRWPSGRRRGKAAENVDDLLRAAVDLRLTFQLVKTWRFYEMGARQSRRQ